MLKPSHCINRIARLHGNSSTPTLFMPFFTKCFFQAIVIIILFTATNNTFAQEKTKKVAGTFVYNGKAYNYEFNKLASNNYSFVVNSLTKNTTSNTDNSSEANSESTPDPTSNTDTTSNAENTPSQFDTTATAPDDAPSPTESPSKQTAQKSVDIEIFDEFSKEIFDTVFRHQMTSKYGASNTGKSANSLNKKSMELFFIIQSKLDFLDDEPVTAHMILKKDEVNSILISNSSNYYNANLSKPVFKNHQIKRVDIETEDGTIKNIVVLLEGSKESRGSLEFKNLFPISISGKHDAERLSEIKLYSFNCNGITGLNRYILFSDILQLNITLENDKEDYSPANKTFTLTPQSSVVELKKEKRSQILSVAAFSDFVGLDQEQPNGLLQIEAKRKINLNTNYAAVSTFWRFPPWKKVVDSDEKLSKYNLGKYNFKKIEQPSKDQEENSIAYQVYLEHGWLVKKNPKSRDTISFPNRRSSKKYLEDHPGGSLEKIDGIWTLKTNNQLRDTMIFSENSAANKYVREHPGNQVWKEGTNWVVKTNRTLAFPDSTSADKRIRDSIGNLITQINDHRWTIFDQKIKTSIEFSDFVRAADYIKKYSGNQIIKKGIWTVKTNKKLKNIISFTDSIYAIKYVRANALSLLATEKRWIVQTKKKPFKFQLFTDSAGAAKYIKTHTDYQKNEQKTVWIVKNNGKSAPLNPFQDSLEAVRYVRNNPATQLNSNRTTWFVKFRNTLAFADSTQAAQYVFNNFQSVLIEAQNIPYEVLTVPNKDYKFGYYAWLPSIEPKLLFSKLDGNNKFLVLDSGFSSRKGINPLKQYQYQLASFGFTTTLLKFSYPQAKINWNVLDVGTYWYRTRVQSIKDTATNNSVAVNNAYLSLGMQVGFKPDSRYGANIGLAYIFQKAFNNDYKFEHNNGLAQASVDAFIKTNEDSEIFFRFRWIYDWHSFRNNFTQIQLGYSMNIFANSGSSK
jgi:hypothetical protein